MSKPRVIVLSVVHQGLTKAQAAERYGVSRQWVHTLVSRYREGGLEAVEPRSSRPQSHPHALGVDVREAIVAIRHELVAANLDAGPLTICWHLEQRAMAVPSTSTVRRVLVAEGLVTPEPKKRPKSSVRRFVADQPNETWQSDFTHWHLADSSDVEIINWLDDHSRYLLHTSVYARITGPIVVDTFAVCVNEFGVPASTLTDNGVVYTARLVGGRNAFEHLLSVLRVDQKNGHPSHPQTQGKVERFHQTLKKWLRGQPLARTLVELQRQLDTFRNIYNEKRPHRGLARTTPGATYRATPKVTPKGGPAAHYRLRFDVVDQFGKLTLRHAGIVHHLGVGNQRANLRVLMLVDDTLVTVTALETGEILSENRIDADRNYWRNELRAAGRWPRPM